MAKLKSIATIAAIVPVVTAPAKAPKASKASKASKSTPAAVVEVPKAKVADGATARPRDRFGCRVGSQSSQINKHIDATPKTCKAIANLVGAENATFGRVYSHLRYLCKHKQATLHADGTYTHYIDPAAAKPAKAPKASKASKASK